MNSRYNTEKVLWSEVYLPSIGTWVTSNTSMAHTLINCWLFTYNRTNTDAVTLLGIGACVLMFFFVILPLLLCVNRKLIWKATMCQSLRNNTITEIHKYIPLGKKTVGDSFNAENEMSFAVLVKKTNNNVFDFGVALCLNKWWTCDSSFVRSWLRRRYCYRYWRR